MWTGGVNVARNYTVNGLNQYLSAGPATFTHDANGNLTSDGTSAYVYDAENRLVSSNASGGTTLSYDPLGRLWKIWSQQTGTTSFVYEGDHVSAEYDWSGTMLRRYFWGPGADEPIIQDEGGALNCGGTRFLHANHQGSIIAASNCDGNLTAINRYDEYGIPQGNWGRFQYTGQAWLPELGMYYYKARIYSATLGRFLQTDPIGYDDQVNLYAYVGNDPVNRTDPTGMYTCSKGAEKACDRVDKALATAKIGRFQKQIYEFGAKREFRQALEAAGERGDNTGIVVTVRQMSNCGDACAFVDRNGTSTVNFSPGTVKNNSDARFAGTALHEFGHSYDQTIRWGGRNPSSRQERYDTERRFTPLGVIVRQVLGESPSGGDTGKSPVAIGRDHAWSSACGDYPYQANSVPGTRCPVNPW